MGTAVHVDGSFGSLPGNVRMVCDHLLGRGIDLFPDPKIRWTAPGIVGGMGLALMLGQSQKRRIPAIAPQSSWGVDRKAKVISDFRARNALRLILVKSGSPFS